MNNPKIVVTISNEQGEVLNTAEFDFKNLPAGYEGDIKSAAYDFADECGQKVEAEAFAYLERLNKAKVKIKKKEF